MRKTANAVNTRQGGRDIRREEGREGEVVKEVGRYEGRDSGRKK